MVIPILARSSIRFYREHPLQLLLSVLGIVLGVGIVTAVWITNSSSQRAFALSTEALYGRTTHHIVAAQGVDQAFYVDLRKDFPDLLAAPVVEGQVVVDNTALSLVGVDPFSELPFERIARGPMESNTAIFNNSGVLLSGITSDRLGTRTGDTLTILSGTKKNNVKLLGTFNSNNPAASDGLLIGDIALVQSVLNRGNKLDRIDVIANTQQADAIRQYLPATLKLSDAASRQQTMLAMTRGFQINLTAMSLLSLLVGAFLIHNTMSFTVLQRRELFAVKRTIGISSRALFLSVLFEAIVISLVGSILGVLLGLLLAHQLIGLTTQTINDLYFVLHVQEIWFTPELFFGGLFLGIGCSVLAASMSAIDAAKTNPVQAHQRSATEHKTRRMLPLLAGMGVVTILFGVALATTPSQSLLFAFLALMLIIVGYGLLLPTISFYASRLLKQSLAGFSPMLSMAAGSVERNISRTGLAIAALTVAVSSTFGVDVMIGSFRNSVDTWLSDTLQSDVYISVPSSVATRTDSVLSNDVLNTFKTNENISSISTGLTLNIKTSVGEFDTLVLTPHNEQPIGINIISNNAASAWNRFVDNQELLISEPMAVKYNLAVGNTLTLFTELEGDKTFKIAGVIRDYASSHGQLTMHRNTFNRYWDNRAVASLGILFKPDVDKSLATDTIRNILKTQNSVLRLQANSEIHANSLAIFDRTFEVTRVLRWLTVGVAFIGVFSALLALNLERAKEFAVLRATGSSRRQLLLLITSQTLWMGLLAGMLALPLGWAMSEVLIHVINVRSFGWSMQSFIPNGTVVSTFILSCTAAILAGLYPAWLLSRSHIAQQLRNET